MNYDDIYCYFMENCRSTNEFEEKVPDSFEEIPAFFDNLTKRKSIATSLFASVREVFQQFGFIVHDDVMYINPISDIQFTNEFGLPFCSEHNMGPDLQYMKETKLTYKKIFSNVENLFYSIVNHSHELLDINLEKNREFFELLFEFQGLNFNEYEAKMKQKNS